MVASAALSHVQAQTCAKPADADWQKVTLVDGSSAMKMDQPVKMSILADGRVFICEMWSGKIKLFTPGSGLTEVAAITVYNDAVENGVLGIAADPNFATNNWVYIFYSRKQSGATFSAGDGNVSPHDHVLVRMTFANGKLGNMKDILSYRRQSKRHSAGGLSFNTATGELFIPTGDDVFPGTQATYWGGRNETSGYLCDLSTAANTNDLRGKVLRIKPLPFADSETPAIGVGTTYTIPAGNLFAPGLAKTRPEIYTMGHRNPYKINIDPISGVGLIGEVGPDAPGPDAARGPTGSDEFNLVTGPGNYGWPFAIADNQPYIAFDGEAYPKGTVFDVRNLKNKSKLNTGIEDLPPAIGALGYYNALNSQTGPNTTFGSGSESAMSGPYYRYDAAKPAARMPAYFHGKWIVGDYSRGKIWALELDANKALKKVELLWNASTIIDLAIGPDGDLYVLTLGGTNNGTLYKMQFKGTHYAATSCSQYVLPPAPPVGIASAPGFSKPSGHRLLVNLASGAQVRAPAGSVHGAFFDLNGNRIWEGAVSAGQLNLPSGLGATLGFVQFQ
jgi:cytochrome c